VPEVISERHFEQVIIESSFAFAIIDPQRRIGFINRDDFDFSPKAFDHIMIIKSDVYMLLFAFAMHQASKVVRIIFDNFTILQNGIDDFFERQKIINGLFKSMKAGFKLLLSQLLFYFKGCHFIPAGHFKSLRIFFLFNKLKFLANFWRIAAIALFLVSEAKTFLPSTMPLFYFSFYLFFFFASRPPLGGIDDDAGGFTQRAEVVFEKILDATVVARRQLIEAAGDVVDDLVAANDIAGDGNIALCLEIHFCEALR
jgi:hypothetical protein